MMEVKHSPASQIEFRSTTNGLPENEVDDMDTLFDDGSEKSLTPASDECDNTAPILNGIVKHSEVLSSTEILDAMEIDLIKEDPDSNDNTVPEAESTDLNKENEETEALSNDDTDVFEIDLEEEPTTKAEEFKGPSNMRDTGDDLDTLLSKINDLVEDCREHNAKPAVSHVAVAEVAGSNISVDDDVVEIPDDDLSDIVDESAAKSTKESESEEEIKVDVNTEAKDSVEVKTETKEEEVKTEVSIDVAVEVTVETNEIPEVSVISSVEQMEVDDEFGDDIVCLDSPIPVTNEIEEEPLSENEVKISESAYKLVDKVDKEEVKEVEFALKEEEQSNKEELAPTEKPVESLQKKDESAEKPVETAKKPSPVIATPTEDDEIYLIEDDDDEDEPMKDDISSEKEEELKESDLKTDEDIENALDAICESSDTTSKATSEVKSPVVDDDEIVCLDDSDKEDEATEPVNKNEEEVKADEVVKDVKAKEVDKIVENIKNPTEKAKENEDKETPHKESEMEVSEKQEVAVKTPAEEVVQEAAEAVAVETAKGIFENTVEEVVEKPVEKLVQRVVDKTVEQVVEAVVGENSETPDQPEDKTRKDDKDLLENSSNVVLDDDIVILDDDEEENEVTIPAKTEQKDSTDSDKNSPQTISKADEKGVEETTSPDESTTMAIPSKIISDNSDNARDGGEEKPENDEAKEVSKEKTSLAAETNSSNSSSNLLKETIAEERDDLEEPSEQPPAKRIRLSQDDVSSRHSTVSMEDTKSNTIDDNEVMEVTDSQDSKSLKRVYSTESIAIAPDFKKPKTEEHSVRAEEVNVVKPEPVKIDVKPKPLALYPPPKLDGPTIDLSLDFLKRFKKSIHKMTKCDLEELVLQKIVEAIVHKSEFSEMRELIEKQEKIITGHRTKITELNKQFRDLEMVHNRVLKDLETKNSQFIMPVKITRAVGLQVFFPNKKYDQPLVPLSPLANAQTSPKTMSSMSSNTVPEKTPVSITPTPNSNSNSNSSSSTQSATANNAQSPAQRCGCVKKTTPMRPDTVRSTPPNRGSQPLPVPAAKESAAVIKVLNRPRQIPANVVTVNNSSTASAQPASRAPLVVAAPKPTMTPPNIAPKKPLTTLVKGSTVVVVGNKTSKPKSCSSDASLLAQPLLPAATIITPVLPSSSLSTPKPVNKSVIDLTDEDDVVPKPPPPVNNSPRTPAPTAPPTPPSAPVAANRSQYKVSVIPQQQLQQPRPNPPKQTPTRPLAAIAPKPNGVIPSIRQMPPNPSRYRHPAPLPNQPIHSSNPAWKLPPARPTIRISNLESGIVISWTIEDTAKEKYAESTSYQIYAYQETSGPPLVESWRHVGDVKAMLLPMAVTLTQFQEGQRYYFAVRAVDAHNRCGPFSFAKTWS